MKQFDTQNKCWSNFAEGGLIGTILMNLTANRIAIFIGPFKIDCLFCASARVGFTSILTATHTTKLGFFLSTKLFSD